MNILDKIRLLNVLRSPEDEGAGGASPAGGEGDRPAPDNDRVAALESRMGSMAKYMQDFVEGQKSQHARSQIETYGRDLDAKVNEAKDAVAKAEADLASAFDEGDGVAIARAQRVLSEQVTARDRAQQNVEAYKARLKQEERRSGGSDGAAGTGQQQVDTTQLDQWKSKHRSWYGLDSEMTKAAHAISDRIKAAGAIPVGSKEYFDVIDRQLRQDFPDRLSGSPSTAGTGQGRNDAPQRRGRISQSVLDGWRRMGINVDDPKTVERMVGHRNTLVNKGILSEIPVTDRIMGR